SASGTSNGLGSVSDSAGNTWVLPAGNPNQNLPANAISGTSSEIAIAYAVKNPGAPTDTHSITSITVTVAHGTSNLVAFAFDLLEFSNVDTDNPVDTGASNTVTPGVTPEISSSVTATTCDAPSTDKLLRGGNYFCSAVSEVVVGIIQGGRSTYS